MAIVDNMISSLEEKIKRVIRFAEELKTHNGQLQQQVDKLSGQIRAKSQEMEVLESKFQSLKLVKTLNSSPEDVRNAKLQVNRMVREIDKCIALLNR
jgi:phage shock protein A